MRGYLQALRIRPFLLYWLGATVSFMGSMVTAVALSWMVYEQTQSTAHVGYMQLASMGPFLLSGLLAGKLLDMFNRVTVMIADNLLRGLLVASVPLLAALGWEIPLWYYYTVAALTGALVMLSAGGGPAVVNKLVGAQHRVAANALEAVSFGAGSLAGPSLGGLLVGWLGAGNTMIVDAVSYALMVLVLLWVPRAAGAVGGGTAGARIGVVAALRAVLVIPAVGAITWLFLAFNFGNGLMRSALPALVDSRMGGGSALFGLLLGAIGAGELAGSVLSGMAGPRWPLGRGIAAALVLSGAVTALLAVVANPALAVAVAFLTGLLHAPLTPWAQTIRMELIPDHLQGRAFALMRGLMMTGFPLAGLIAGQAEALAGLQGMVVLAAFFATGPVLLFWRPLDRYDRAKRLPQRGQSGDPSPTAAAAAVAGPAD